MGMLICPKCKRELHTSFPEQAILFYLNKKFAQLQRKQTTQIKRMPQRTTSSGCRFY